MLRRALAGLRARLIAMVILAVIPALILILYTASRQRLAAGAEAQDAALKTARLAADDYLRYVEGAHQLLAALAHIDELTGSEDVECNSLFASLHKDYPLYANLFGARADGTLFCSAVTPLGPVSFADAPWFGQVVSAQNFVIGDHEIDRVTRKPVVVIAHPVIGQDGRTESVVGASLDLAWLQQFAATARVPSGWTVALLDVKGTPLAGYPLESYLTGEPAAGSAGLALLPNGSPEALAANVDGGETDGVFESRDASGVARLYAFASIAMPESAGRLTVLVGTPVELALREADADLARSLASLALVEVLAILGAWMAGNRLVLRQAHGLQAAVRDLQQGNLAARAEVTGGARELREVAATFNQMADTIQRRGAELQQAHDQLEARVEERTSELQAANRALQTEIAARQHKEQALRQSQAQLIQAEKMAALGRLAAALAHEINNPLQAVQTYLELLTMGVSLAPEKRTEYLGVARSEIERLGRLVGRVLDFARPARSHREPVSVVRLVEETLVLTGKRLQQAGIRLETDLQPVPEVTAAPDQLVQVFINLLINAVESLGSGGTIAVATSCTGGDVSVSFADDGPPIPADDLPHIFEPFFTTKPGGTGLGLSVCHSLVAEHGGVLSVRNNVRGYGVVVTVTLPCRPGPEPINQTEASYVG